MAKITLSKDEIKSVRIAFLESFIIMATRGRSDRDTLQTAVESEEFVDGWLFSAVEQAKILPVRPMVINHRIGRSIAVSENPLRKARALLWELINLGDWS